ncbi:MAG: hypothetical protein K6E98_05730 [Lachnospiraceae bacterium]|nr:hypothetical protein [Lachnospiraceae bacterium]
MACFTAPLVESVIVSAVTKAEEKKEMSGSNASTNGTGIKIPLSRRLKWLTNMLYGGSAILAFEHIWHGEIVPWFPFLTAMSNAKDTANMLNEIATVGVSMAGLITVVWLGVCAVATSIVNRPDNTETSKI